MVPDVAHLVRQHPGDLPRVQAPQEPFGDADRRTLDAADGEGVGLRRRNPPEPRQAGQLGTAGELVDNFVELRRLAGLEGSAAVHPQHPGGRNPRSEGQDQEPGDERDHDARKAQERGPDEHQEPSHSGQDQGRVQEVALAVLP